MSANREFWTTIELLARVEESGLRATNPKVNEVMLIFEGLVELAGALVSDDADTATEADAIMEQMYKLSLQKRQSDILDLLWDWRGRRLLSEALGPDWDFDQNAQTDEG